MDITSIPFNEFLGLKRAERDPPHLLQLEDRPAYANHVGTVHAGAQLALAEASSAECLLRAFQQESQKTVAVVRTVRATFRKPLTGRAYSRARIADDDLWQLPRALAAKGMGIIRVHVEIVDEHDVVVMNATIGWFIQKQPGP